MTNTNTTAASALQRSTMICNIINPSDPYTLECDDFNVAAVAIAYLGNGRLGLESLEDDSLRTPVLFGWEDWFKDRGIELSDYSTAEKHSEMAAVLESVLIGQASDRKRYFAILKRCEDPEEFKREYHDDKRSSMNDIGNAAWQLAASFSKSANAKAKATQPTSG